MQLQRLNKKTTKINKYFGANFVCNFGRISVLSFNDVINLRKLYVCSKGSAKAMPGNSIPWKYFPHYWHFVQGIHRRPVDLTLKGPVRWNFNVFLQMGLNKLLSKHLSCPWIEMPWHSCDITVMVTHCSGIVLLMCLANETLQCNVVSHWLGAFTDWLMTVYKEWVYGLPLLLHHTRLSRFKFSTCPTLKILYSIEQFVWNLEEKLDKIHLPNWQFFLPHSVG